MDVDLKHGITAVLPFIWYKGPDFDLIDPRRRNPLKALTELTPQPSYRDRYTRMSAKDIDWEYMPTYLKGLTRNELCYERNGRFYSADDGFRPDVFTYGLQIIRVLIIDAKSHLPPEVIRDVCWPCGPKLKEQRPPNPNYKAFKRYSCKKEVTTALSTQDSAFKKSVRAIRERQVAHSLVQRSLWSIALVLWRQSRWKTPFLQMHYDLACYIWNSQRSKYGLALSCRRS